MLFVVDIDASNEDIGLKFRLNASRAVNHFQLDEGKIRSCLPSGFEDLPSSELYVPHRDPNWFGFKGYFHCNTDIDRFLCAFERLSANEGTVNSP